MSAAWEGECLLVGNCRAPAAWVGDRVLLREGQGKTYVVVAQRADRNNKNLSLVSQCGVIGFRYTGPPSTHAALKNGRIKRRNSTLHRCVSKCHIPDSKIRNAGTGAKKLEHTSYWPRYLQDVCRNARWSWIQHCRHFQPVQLATTVRPTLHHAAEWDDAVFRGTIK